MTDWQNRSAADYIHILATLYGQPSAVDPTLGGLAIWKRELLQNTCLDRLEVRDEAIPHCVPANHLDFVYVFVKYELTPSKRTEVLSLTRNVGYDQAQKLLWARCGTVHGAIATLALVTQIGNGSINLNYALANELLAHYLVASQIVDQSDQLYDLLCFNVRH
jgi:hypothetical protein